MKKDKRKYKLEDQRFGRLLVLEYLFGKLKYKCICDCGNFKEVPSGDLRSGAVQSCGCLHAERELDIVGQKFNNLLVVERLEETQNGRYLFKCLCDCGNDKIVEGRQIKTGRVNSCGCMEREARRNAQVTHGMTYTRVYAIYSKMKLRCYNKTNKSYLDYGGRGVKICDEWLGENGFINFMNWAMENGYKEHLSIDRIDVNGNYEPSNCRWATIEEQANNKRTNLFFTYNNETKTLAQWCVDLRLKYDPVHKRIKSGYSFEKAITFRLHKVKIN